MFTVQYAVVAMASEVPPREVVKVTSSIDSFSRGDSVLWSPHLPLALLDITSCALQPLPIRYVLSILITLSESMTYALARVRLS